MGDIRQTEIQNCSHCGKGVCHSGCISFYIVKVRQMVVDTPAVQRQTGLEMMLGGNAAIANAMGGDPVIARQFSEHEVWVCQDCAIHEHGSVLNLVAEDDRKRRGDDDGG